MRDSRFLTHQVFLHYQGDNKKNYEMCKELLEAVDFTNLRERCGKRKVEDLLDKFMHSRAVHMMHYYVNELDYLNNETPGRPDEDDYELHKALLKYPYALL